VETALASPTQASAPDLARRVGIVVATLRTVIGRGFAGKPHLTLLGAPLWNRLSRILKRFQDLMDRLAACRAGAAARTPARAANAACRAARCGAHGTSLGPRSTVSRLATESINPYIETTVRPTLPCLPASPPCAITRRQRLARIVIGSRRWLRAQCGPLGRQPLPPLPTGSGQAALPTPTGVAGR